MTVDKERARGDVAVGNEVGSINACFKGEGMTPSELELFSTQVLIDEIVRRTTFQGVIIHSTEEAKSRDWDGRKVFLVRLNENLEAEEAGRLLDVVSRHIAFSASE